MSTCKRCGQSDLSERIGKNGRPYLAHVETYPSGRSYFRSLHTTEKCDEFKARIAELVQQERDRVDREEFREYCFERRVSHFGDSLDQYGKGSPEVVALWESMPSEEQMRTEYDATH